jgi:hypothetical protein
VSEPQYPEIASIDDGSASFMRHREDFRQANAAEDIMARVMRRRAQTAKPDASATANATGLGVVGTAAAIGSDIGEGIIEAPLAAAHGVVDAVRATGDLAGEFATWINDKLPVGGLVFDDKGVRFAGADEFKSVQKKGGSALSKIPQPIQAPDSTTGKLVEGISQFLTGFIVGGKALKGAKATAQAAGPLAKWALSAAQGAVTDFTVFDAHEARLSDLIQSQPALANPITEYLASNPEDSEAEGRFKNALEGLGLGVATDGMLLGLKTLRQARIAKATQNQARAAAGLTEEVRPKIEPTEFQMLGDAEATAPLVQAGKVAKAADATTGIRPADVGKGETADLFVNFARIDSPEDVKTVIQDMADRLKPDIDDARRGKQTFKQIKLNAEQVNAWDVLMERRAGAPLNAEQSVAARQLWVSSADKLKSVAQEAAQNPSEANLFAFRKMLATHHAIQTEVIAARTETARALASWRIPAGSSAERFRDVSAVLEANGGGHLTREMADRVAKLANAGMYSEMDEFVRGSAYARTRDAMQEAWIMGLLSGPKTHIVNMMSNTSVIGMQMYERATAAQISKLLGTQGGVEAGEAMQQLFGITQGFKDALRYAKKAAITGETGFGMNKVELPRQGAISSEAFNLSNEGWAGRAVDGIGTLVRTPGRALGAEDEFFKTIGYRMELNAQENLKGRIAEILENPPESVRMAAVDQATYQTFTNTPGAIAQKLLSLTNQYPALKVLLPFVRTPANILRYTFERTPLAPLMQHVRADVAAGGARKDLALARMATGTAVMLTGADLAMSGQVTGGGPVDPAQRANLQRTGWQPYSVKLGKRWYAYNRLDPLGSTLGMTADMVEILQNTDGSDPNFDPEEAATAVTAAIGANVLNKTYLSGLADFFEAMADPKRRAEGFAQGLAGSLVPAAVNEVAKAQDPYAREVFTMLDAMKKRTPGLSDSLPLRRDLWGRPVETKSGIGWAYDAFSPIYSKKENPEPIDTELMRLEAPLSMPARRVGFDGVTVDLDRFPGAYSRYLELSGNELKDPAWNMGAKEFLNAVVSGDHPMSAVYQMRSDGPDGTKAEMIADVMNRYRAMARRQLLTEFPAIRAEVSERQDARRQLRGMR